MAQMGEKLLSGLCEMVSYAGGARSSYILAVQAAKECNEEECARRYMEGDELLQKAHDIHYEILSMESAQLEKTFEISIFLVHVEDQFMAAESFRIMAAEFIDLYKLVKR